MAIERIILVVSPKPGTTWSVAHQLAAGACGVCLVGVAAVLFRAPGAFAIGMAVCPFFAALAGGFLGERIWRGRRAMRETPGRHPPIVDGRWAAFAWFGAGVTAACLLAPAFQDLQAVEPLGGLVWLTYVPVTMSLGVLLLASCGGCLAASEQEASR